jgi:hypothetical protein
VPIMNCGTSVELTMIAFLLHDLKLNTKFPFQDYSSNKCHCAHS